MPTSRRTGRRRVAPGASGGGPIAVIGGGIAGLSAAIWLRALGLEVDVYERSITSRTSGLGINLQPYAVAALEAVGLAEKVASAGRPCRRWAFFDRRGNEIVSEPLEELDGWPRTSISRGVLSELLTAAAVARGCTYHADRGLTGLEQSGDHVLLEFVDPCGSASRERARAAVGADGISSTVRRLLVPSAGGARHAGKVLWRGTTRHAPVLDGDTMVIAGTCAKKFVLYPIGPTHPDGDQDLNWVAEMAWRDDAGREAWDDAVAAEAVAETYRELDFGWLSVPEVILGADEVLRFSMLDREPLDRWSFGRVTLAGDAAHPMYPVGSHGASQAIRDAAALGAAVSAGRVSVAGEIGEAFVDYEAVRRPQANALVLANREMGPDSVLDLAERSGATDRRALREQALSVLKGYRQLTDERLPG